MKILIINGPNLNLLGKREASLYGKKRFEDFLILIQDHFAKFKIDYFQSNVEGELVNKIQEAEGKYDGVVLNAAAYTHTSVAIADALRAIRIPAVEVHITNILSREDYRHISLVAPACRGSIMGFGLDSYRLAIEALRVIHEEKI